jgi:hypothetical protein
MPATIATNLAALWGAYAGVGQASGRFPCPVRVLPYRGAPIGEAAEATHIYRGFGAIRLERIAGPVAPGKGFRGDEIASAPATRATARLFITD